MPPEAPLGGLPLVVHIVNPFLLNLVLYVPQYTISSDSWDNYLLISDTNIK